MKKTNPKRLTDDGPVYMEFKSYKHKNPIPKRIEPKTTLISLPSSFGENIRSERCPRYKELQQELKLLEDKQIQLTRSIKKLQAENASLKTHVETLITPQTHQQLQLELDRSENLRQTLQRTITELQTTVEQLNTQISSLQNAHRDLRAQLQIEQRLNIERTQQRQQQTKETESLQRTIQTLTNEKEILEREIERLDGQVDQLKVQIAGMDEKVNVISVVQKKLKIYETQLQRTSHQNKVLADQNESVNRFVKVLENDTQTIKDENFTVAEKNKELHKLLSTMKKNFERLRHKYDEVNKDNKILKEKETRYLLHERFNVGKYAKAPTISEIRNATAAAADLRSNLNVQDAQMNNYMRAANNVKTKNSEQFDQRYHLLHRPRSVREKKSHNNNVNKTKK